MLLRKLQISFLQFFDTISNFQSKKSNSLLDLKFKFHATFNSRNMFRVHTHKSLRTSPVLRYICLQFVLKIIAESFFVFNIFDAIFNFQSKLISNSVHSWSNTAFNLFARRSEDSTHYVGHTHLFARVKFSKLFWYHIQFCILFFLVYEIQCFGFEIICLI